MLWAVLIGSTVLVVSLRWFSTDGVTGQDVVSVVIAVSAVAGYAIYAWLRRTDLPITPDQAGDNAYYIGLVLTFASLGVALVKLVGVIGPESQEEAKRVAQLIPDFGVALSSTVAGIIARLALQQQRQSPAEAEEQANRDLHAAVREFSRNLRIASGEIRQATLAVRLGIAKQLEDAALEHVENFEAVQEMVREAAEAMVARMSELAGDVAEANGKMVGELSRAGGAKLGDEIEGLTEVVGRTRDALDGMVKITAAVAGEMGAVDENMELLSTRLSSLPSEADVALVRELVVRAGGMADRVASELDQAGNDAAIAGDALDQFRKSATEGRELTARLVEQVRGVEGSLDSARIAVDAEGRGVTHGVMQGAESLRRSMSDAERDLRAASEEVQREAGAATKQVRERADALGRTMADSTRRVDAAFGEIEGSANGAAAAVESYRGIVRDSASRIGEGADGLCTDMDESRKALADTGNAVRNLNATDIDAFSEQVRDVGKRAVAAVDDLERAAEDSQAAARTLSNAARRPRNWTFWGGGDR